MIALWLRFQPGHRHHNQLRLDGRRRRRWWRPCRPPCFSCCGTSAGLWPGGAVNNTILFFRTKSVILVWISLAEFMHIDMCWPVPFNAMLFQEEGCGEGGKERKTFWQRLVGRRRQWYKESLKEIEKKKGKRCTLEFHRDPIGKMLTRYWQIDKNWPKLDQNSNKRGEILHQNSQSCP